MACLHPIRILNPKRKFSQVGGHPLYITVPCGHCAECEKAKLDEYMFRSYYEAYDTFINGGFVLNDTLTYRDGDLPRLSDYVPTVKNTPVDCPCFSTEDLRLFFVRLRKCLKDKGYDPKYSLKYFCASEYGTSEQHTHRPHYHVLFFVNGIDISPLDFSRLVARCWVHGRTDGLPYQSSHYVLHKRVFSLTTNSDLVHLQMVTSYVAKYLAKDTDFKSCIDSRIEKAVRFLFPNKEDSPEAVDLRGYVSRRCSQFHRQSHHFGECALKYNDITAVKESGMMSMPCKDGVVKHIPIPTYFARKMFYQLQDDFRGKKQWCLTPAGVQYRLNRFDKSVDYMARTLQSWYDSLHITNPDNFDSIRSVAHEYLAGRSFTDFAVYLLAYKDRIVPINDNVTTPINKALPDVSLFYPLQFEDECCAYLYRGDPDEPINYKCVAFTWYGDKDNPLPIYGLPHTMSLREYTQRCVISEQTYHEFRDFDKLFNLYTSSLIITNHLIQSAYEEKKRLKKVFKAVSLHLPINPNFT